MLRAGSSAPLGSPGPTSAWLVAADTAAEDRAALGCWRVLSAARAAATFGTSPMALSVVLLQRGHALASSQRMLQVCVAVQDLGGRG